MYTLAKGNEGGVTVAGWDAKKKCWEGKVIFILLRITFDSPPSNN